MEGGNGNGRRHQTLALVRDSRDGSNATNRRRLGSLGGRAIAGLAALAAGCSLASVAPAGALDTPAGATAATGAGNAIIITNAKVDIR